MGNTNKTDIYIAKLRVGQYLFLFDICYYLEVSLIYSKLK